MTKRKWRPTLSIRLLNGVYSVGASTSSNRSAMAAEVSSAHPISAAGRSGFSVSTTDEDVTSSSECGACRSNAVTAVPQ